MSEDPLNPFQVNVILPARNAAETIAATLESLLAQTYRLWDAIIVDDGSSDRTASIAAEFAARDPRFRVLPGPQRGVSAARNLGLASTSAPWVLFLDADDTILPPMLEKMVAGLKADPTADAIHCGWTCTDPQGTPVESRRCEILAPDLFPLFSNYCGFIIHSCLVRRSQLEKIGGFDESLRTSEDFDLWQRVARIGTRFTHTPEFLSIYRLRPNSTWFNSGPFLDDVLRVARRGHAPDPRLPAGLIPARYLNGAPAANLPTVEVRMVMWAAAMALARNENPSLLLDRLPAPSRAAVDPKDLGAILFQAVPFTLCRHESAWLELFPELIQRIDHFLREAEHRWAVPQLRTHALHALEDHIIPAIAERSKIHGEAILFSATAILSIDIESPLNDFLPPPGINRIVCIVRAGDRSFGLLTFPVVDGKLLSIVIADGIAGRFAWPLLELFLVRQKIYGQVTVTRSDADWTAQRSGVTLGSFRNDPSSSLHDRVGWTLFLQELFERPLLTSADFYGNDDLPSDLPPRSAQPENTFELTAPIQPIQAPSAEPLIVRATIGGAPVAVAQVSTDEGLASEANIRLALLANAGMELARTAVREGILGRSLDDPRTLNQRLREKASKRPREYVHALAQSEGAAVLVLGASASVGSRQIARRLTLPAAKAALALDAAGPEQPVLRLGQGTVGQVLYLPEWKSAVQPDTQTPSDIEAEQQPGVLHDRQHFEVLFARGADPWQYTSRYEQLKYEQTLSLIPEDTGSSALEVGCAEGYFTAQLLPRVESLVIADISEIALERTLERCASSKLSARQIDLTRDPIKGKYDLIVCSEILYYMGDSTALARVARKLADALEPGGWLVTAHANQVQDDPEEPGFDWGVPYGARVIGETFAQLPDLIFEKELRTPLYRIQRFRRRSAADSVPPSTPSTQPREQIIADNAPPEPAVAANIARAGRPPAQLETALTTTHLPILMYHNVASTGPAPLDRWRVTPEVFAGQMRYLKQAGFSCSSLAEWRSARRDSKPLTGRRVLITFDDGYVGFEQHVLPVLQRNGFSAILFVPTDHVGGRAVWDGPDGEQLQLMDWNALRRLRDAGISIGAHSCTHRQLTDLTVNDLVDELAGARLALRRELQIEADAIAYPFGAWDEAVARVAGACGYIHGLTTRDGTSNLKEDGLSLSRIEVKGDYTLEQFIANLT